MIAIGSFALRQYNGLAFPRPEGHVSDIDLIMTDTEFNDMLNYGLFHEWYFQGHGKIRGISKHGTQYEIELLPATETSRMLHELSTDNYTNIGPFLIKIPPLDYLYAMKKAHIGYPVNWEKNISDYHRFKALGIKLSPEAYNFYTARKAEIETRFSTHVNLKVSNDKFFGQYDINRYYNHDDLHEWVKHEDVPMYKKIKHDQDMALCNYELWQELSYSQKLNTVREEVYSIALERVMIPFIMTRNKFYDYHKAYEWALMRVSTTLTKGWFKEFAIENWPMLRDCQLNLVDVCREHVYDARQL